MTTSPSPEDTRAARELIATLDFDWSDAEDGIAIALAAARQAGIAIGREQMREEAAKVARNKRSDALKGSLAWRLCDQIASKIAALSKEPTNGG